MKTNRRRFITHAALGGLAATTLPFSSCDSVGRETRNSAVDYTELDKVARLPVFKRELFDLPVIIETVELLRLNDTFLCRVRSKDGAVGISVANSLQMRHLYPIFVNRVQPFFIGKDARDLDTLLDDIYVYASNYKLQSVALWVPVATLEFAILDMMGRIANIPMGKLFGDIHHTEMAVYQAHSKRGITPEETIRQLQAQLSKSGAKAIKFKVGGRMSAPEEPKGRSERLVPLVRETFGDDMVISADSNGSYDVDTAIRIGKIMQEYNYDFYEEPVPFDWYEETRQVAQALDIPIAGGEQEASMHNLRWLIGTDALQVIQHDQFYFGGMIRSMKVARMAALSGKICTPHTTGDGFGYLYLAHFISAVPHAGRFHEFKDLSKNLPFVCETSSLTAEDGVVKIPSGPGLGVDVDPDYIAKHVLVEV